MEDYEDIIMIKISDIRIVNPRVRSKEIHDELVVSIKNIGLKKPITVRVSDEQTNHCKYDLICGQGRLEAFIILGEEAIPAIIKSVSGENGHIMSLAENIARRRPRSTELLNSIMDLKNKGYTDSDIAEKIGCSKGWVKSILGLMDKGENKLLGAVETGKMPLYLAVEISKAKGDDIQSMLLDGFNLGTFSPKQIAVIKKVLNQRDASGKSSDSKGFIQGVKKKKLTPEALQELYQNNVKMHKMIHTRSEFTMSSLLVVNELMANLLKDDEFVSILEQSNLNSIPSFILENSIPERGYNND